MKQKLFHISLYIILFIFISLLLFTKPFIGLSDNGDYYRVIQPLGFITNDYPGFFYSVKQFHLATVQNGQEFFTAIKNILDPNLENYSEYTTTQSLFIKMAMIVNFVVHTIINRDISTFDIRFLGITYIFFYSIGLYLYLKNTTFQKRNLKFVHILLTLFMFCDIGYLLYFHSFFGEAAILVSFFWS